MEAGIQILTGLPSMLALQHGGGGKRDRGRHTKLHPYTAPLLSTALSFPGKKIIHPSPSHQVRSPTPPPTSQMQAAGFGCSYCSPSLGFPETNLIDLEIRNPLLISLLEEIGLLTVCKWVICKTQDSKVLKKAKHAGPSHTSSCGSTWSMEVVKGSLRTWMTIRTPAFRDH